MRSLVTTLTFLLFGISTMAAIKTETIEYKQGDAVLEGYMAHNPAVRMRQPAVIIVHAWKGLNDFAKQKADEMAKQGYVAFAADIYGKGIRPADNKQAAEQAGKYKGDRNLLRARAQAAYEALRKNPKVDPNKIVAMGYCFGGTTVLEMALAGLPLAGVVSFHGGLEFPNLADVKNIKSKILILHGAIDPNVPPEQVNTFLKALNENPQVDYQFIAYSNAVHSFTEPSAGNDISKGAAYNAVADRRSTEAMQNFFKEVTR